MKKIFLSLLILQLFNIAKAQISINPGDNIPAIVNANPAGTTFNVKAGLYRMQWIVPKDNDIFIAEPGVILNGSKVLTSFVREGNFWVATGQTQQEQVHGSCITGYECASPEDLFFDDQPLWKVSTKAEVVPGKWFFDYASDKIYFLDDPTGKKVETSVTKHAFEGSADNVTIRGFIIEKHANPAQFGAINCGAGNIGNAGVGWIIEDNEVRLNHGRGISFSDYAIVRHNFIHDNGQLGIGGGGFKALVENNEISHNCEYAGFNWGWEGGGTKFSGTDSLIVRNNHSHNNAGPGLWTDIDNIHTLYEGNVVEDNAAIGIFHEISYDAVIRCNTLRRNGINDDVWLWGGQICIAASQNVKVYNNTLLIDAAGGNGIALIQQNRGSGKYGPCLVLNDSIYNNEIFHMGNSGASGAVMDCNCNANIFTKNYFDKNIYHLPDPVNQSAWTWNNQWLMFSQFKNAGQELNGIANTDTGTTPIKFSGCASCGTLSISSSSTNADCGKSNGSITVTALGGTAPYTYSWNTIPVQTTKTASGLSGGIYTVIVSDKNSCPTTQTVNVTKNVCTGIGCTTQAAPVIDGQMDAAWSALTSYTIGNNVQGPVSSSLDLSGYYKLMWDNTYLYVIAIIKDDVKKNDSPQAYDDDAIELFIDGNNDKATTYDANDHQYLLRWNDNIAHELHSGSPMPDNPAGIDFAQSNTADGYILETRIAFSTIGVTPSNGKNIGFDIHLDDDDDGGPREVKQTWETLTDQSYANPGLFGIITLNAVPCSTVTGINPDEKFVEVKIYPNPFHGNFNLTISSEVILKEAILRIYDVCGKEVKNISINNHETIIDKGALQNGIYFYSITNNNERIANEKLIVQ